MLTDLVKVCDLSLNMIEKIKVSNLDIQLYIYFVYTKHLRVSVKIPKTGDIDLGALRKPNMRSQHTNF